jgi:hypothetical protein
MNYFLIPPDESWNINALDKKQCYGWLHWPFLPQIVIHLPLDVALICNARLNSSIQTASTVVLELSVLQVRACTAQHSDVFWYVLTCLGLLGHTMLLEALPNEKCACSSCGKGTKIQCLTKCHDHHLLWCQSIVPSIGSVGTSASEIQVFRKHPQHSALEHKSFAMRCQHCIAYQKINNSSEIFWETWGVPHRQIHQGNVNQQDLSAVRICPISKEIRMEASCYILSL